MGFSSNWISKNQWDLIWTNMIWLEQIWSDLILLDTIWSFLIQVDSIPFDPIWSNWSYSIYFDPILSNLIWTDFIWFDQISSKLFKLVKKRDKEMIKLVTKFQKWATTTIVILTLFSSTFFTSPFSYILGTISICKKIWVFTGNFWENSKFVNKEKISLNFA